ncbi:VapE domain-containing protein [Caballeronia sordidicola]|uniref:VapE domain-containing protein n=1 Tax=Caballeronia sordidicola TaxID=196367 RepID=UPI00068E12DD|nr:VapE domain-containing protein [Caballeronia sordidicola]
MAKKIIRPSVDNIDDTRSLDLFELEAQGYASEAVVSADWQKAARAVAKQETEQRIVEATKIVDLVERAKNIAEDILFEDIRKVRMGDMFIAVPEDTATNRRTVLDYLFKDASERPRFDEFKGRVVDHRGVIIDDFYDATEYLDAFNAAGLRKMEFNKVIEAVRLFALRHRQNDLTQRVLSVTPEWDGVKRMDSALIRMFDAFDTPLNRAFGVYFWTSFFMRVTRPGEEAPIVLTLIGAQNCGKSYFGKLLARLITGNREADSVQYDLDTKPLDLLRDITGHSVVCALGELAGYQRSDVNRLKNLITRTHDQMHQKFEGVLQQARQWIFIADANRYNGLLRDETGNRRFYPMFCAQTTDHDGNTAWREDFKADFSDFESNLWQLMAEARAWIEENGIDGYSAMVRDVSRQVFEWSQGEAKAGRGVIQDDSVLPFVPAALSSAPCREVKKRDGSGISYVFYDRVDLISAIIQAATPIDPTREKRFLTDLAKACAMKGGAVPALRDSGRVPGFAFYDHPNKAALLADIGVTGDQDEVRLIAGTPSQPSGF